MTGPTSARGSRTRERILAVFTAMVADRGYAQTAIADIAQEVGVSKGAILHHFGSKDVLLERMGSEFIDRRNVEITYATERLDDPVDQFAAIVFSTMYGVGYDIDASRAFGREFSVFRADPRMAPVRERRQVYADMVLGIIERCIDAQVLRREEPALLMLEIFGMCNWAWTWYRPEGALSPEQLAERFATTLLRGMAPEAGTLPPAFDADRVMSLVYAANGLERAPRP
jgi:TetR/AcrR family transcriptional regulator, cholesterol catabolism regulator